MKKIIRQFYYWAALLFSKIVLFIPYSLAVQTGGFLGLIAYYAVAKARKITLTNLKESFPEKSLEEIEIIAKKTFINQGKNLFELFSFPKLDKDKISAIADIEYKSNFAKAFEYKKGVLMASAHCGNWEIMGAALSLEGFPINVIAKRIYIEGLNNMLVGFRKSKGSRVILRSGQESAREILRSLRQNEAIGMLIDQDTSVPGVFVNFFSRLAWTPAGLAALALRTGAAVVMAFDVRLPDDKHKILISEPVMLSRTGDNEKDILENTQMITGLIEKHIRKHPEQWVWMHERWKTQKGQ